MFCIICYVLLFYQYEEAVIELSGYNREPIAIIGMGCRFPGAADPQGFWNLLRQGNDGVREVPTDRWDINELFDQDTSKPGKMSSRNGGFVDNVDQFDWRAFRIPPREAKYMDPQHRLLLEVAWEAMEDAGIPFEKVAGSRVGVFVAAMWNDYFRLQSKKLDSLNSYTVTGNASAFAANRISYVFDLRGPSVVVDSACAGSLASVHIACQSLWMGESSLAIAGGVNLILSPDASVMMSKAGLLSPEGHCKTLDARADGFVRGEGVGLVILKPLSKVTTSDRVYATIRGSAMNHNGHNEWIMASNAAGQETVLRDAYGMAGIDPAEIDYIELHGTGLPKGDPIEANVVGEVVGKRPGRNHSCIVGSVKSNIGHLESAAGIASIIKVALSLYHREIPPTLHFQEINPAINLESLGLAVQQKLSPWPNKTGPALAGLTAISLAGVNAHMVLEAFPHNEESSPQSDVEFPQLFPLSARSPEALLVLVRVFKAFLDDYDPSMNISLNDIVYTAAVHRSHHEERIALVVNSKEELFKSLDAIIRGEKPNLFFSSKNHSEYPEIGPDIAEKVNHFLGVNNNSGKAISSLPVESVERVVALEALGQLYVKGNSLDWEAMYPDRHRFISLPTYPWQRERIWLEWLDIREPAQKPEPEILHDQQSSTEQQHGLLLMLEESPASDRLGILKANIQENVARVLGLDQSNLLESNQRLFEAGLTSLSAVELMNNLENSLGIKLPATLVFEYPTIDALSGYLAKDVLRLDLIKTSATNPQQNPIARQNKFVNEVDGLTEEEAEALLLKKLKEARK